MKRFTVLWLLIAAPAFGQTIVSSEVLLDNPQLDGRRWVTERHVDDEGREYLATYMAEADAKPEDMLPIRAAQIEAEIEAEKNRPPPEKSYTISQIEAAFKDAEKGGLELNKLKESLGKLDTGELTVTPADVDPAVPVEPIEP